MIPIDKIKNMSTRQLMSVYDGVRASIQSDRYYHKNYYLFKYFGGQVEINEIKALKKALKAELNTREHIPNKIEARKLRQLAAKNK